MSLLEQTLLFVWAACLCFAFLGYGRLILRLCGLRNPPWALAGCIGIACLIAVGGVLEIAGFIRPAVLAIIVLLGGALFMGRRQALRWPLGPPQIKFLKGNWIAALLLCAIVVLGGIRLIGNLEARYFHVNDDLGGYLSFPAEMLQLGSLPSDPFSERRIESGLGASYFLQTFTMIAGDARTLRFVDWGFGSILYVGIVFAIGRRLKLSVANSLLLALLTFVIPLRRTNSTMVVLPAALFGALFLLEIMEEPDESHVWLRPALLGITAGAISALKSTYLPAAVLVCAFYYLAAIARDRRGLRIAQGAICALAASCVLVPWMLDLKAKEGTYLFPALGRGYEASAYGTVPLPSGSHGFDSASLHLVAALVPLTVPFLLALAAGWLAQRQKLQAGWLEASSFFLAIVLATCVVAFATQGDSIARYSLPFLAPGMIIFSAYVVRWANLRNPRPVWLQAALAFSALWVVALAVRYGIREHVYENYSVDLGFQPGTQDEMRFDANVEKRRVAALQASVPAGQPILEHLFVSYPLDFKRNPIFIADFPGLAGPPPGMPFAKGPESLRNYLLAHGLRFIAFSVGRGRIVDISPEFTFPQLVAHPALGGRHTWLFIQNKVACDAQANFDALAKRYAQIYDDGEALLIDLKTPQHSSSETVFDKHQRHSMGGTL